MRTMAATTGHRSQIGARCFGNEGGCNFAVKRATLDVYPEGRAAKANVMPLTELKPAPDYEKVIETCGGHGEKVEAPADLMPALKRGLAAVRSGTPALLNVLTQPGRG